jgi:hypothetical protein
MFAFNDPVGFTAFLRTLGVPDTAQVTSEHVERHADAFRDAFDALARSDTTNLRPDVAGLVRRLVERPPFTRN